VDVWHRAPFITVVIAREGGRSSTPRLLGSIIGVCGILDRPVKPGDDSCEQLNTVIAGIAKQSIGQQKERMDCFAALAMTA
jgi:hypothetical protein